eukprot:15435576-Alexandrium_andersonii.AAC.1
MATTAGSEAMPRGARACSTSMVNGGPRRIFGRPPAPAPRQQGGPQHPGAAAPRIQPSAGAGPRTPGG